MTDVETAEPMPETVAAIAALSSLRAAYPYLAEIAETEAYGGRQASVPRTPMSAAAKTRTDELLRTERAYRDWMQLKGIQRDVAGSGLLPVRPALLDAEQLAETTVIDQAWIVASALRQTETWLASPTPLRGPVSWNPACTYLGVAIFDIAPALAVTVAQELTVADRAVRIACGLADVRIPIPGHPDCPACGRRTLRIDVTNPDDRHWTIACRADCFCLGSQCSCGRPGRKIGQAHLWSAVHFATGRIRTLRRLANSQARARRARSPR